jgi:hypothetical protein
MRARRSHHKVGAVLLQCVLVLLDGQAPEDHGCLDGRHVLGEALILFADQEGQLSCVAHHQHRHLVDRERGRGECLIQSSLDSRETRLCKTQDYAKG